MIYDYTDDEVLELIVMINDGRIYETVRTLRYFRSFNGMLQASKELREILTINKSIMEVEMPASLSRL